MGISKEIQQTNFRSENHKAMVNLIFSSNWLLERIKKFLEKGDITHQQYNILRILRGKHPEPISAVEIKSRMLDKHSDVSRLLDRLIGKKLVVKNKCPNDKRASNISIALSGMALLEKLDQAINNIDSKMLKLSKEESKQLSDLLDKGRN